MSEPTKTPFEPFFDEIRRIVREEIGALKGNNGHESPALLTIEQAAKALGVPRSWISEAARRGEIPHVRLGHYVRFEEKDLAEFVRQRKNDKRS